MRKKKDHDAITEWVAAVSAQRELSLFRDQRPTVPGVDPDNASFHVVHSEPIGPTTTACFSVDGASAFTAHGCCLNPGQTGIPVRPEQNTVNGK